ncbi:MAG: CapA family protein [Sphingomonas sp.]|jgi:poly-gamma-glutamate synthesis protein (capsule biosynthesis protein)|uniref:CapA family protein n=1 Tax=Sphingomonas sp. TaxID=28214 RepID=UPI00356B301B
MVETFHRRAIVAAGMTLPAWRLMAAARPRDLRVALLGQALIQQDLRRVAWPGRAAIAALLGRADIAFTDLETAIAGDGLTPTRQSEVLHMAPPAVIDCLAELGVTLVATSNNHAWDLGTPGITAALAALDARHIAHAGSGRDLAAASAAATRASPAGSVALVAAAAGAIREGAAATATRPGVNELRRGADGALLAEDVARVLASIGTARRRGDTVIAYLHNHYWETDPADTPGWQRDYARQCIDAGAAVFVAHGPPLLQGIERYKGAPLFHGLGSMIFQTRKGAAAYGTETWQSLAVDARFRAGRFVGARLVPLQLDGTRDAPDAEFTRGTPAIAHGPQAPAILARVTTLSAGLGYALSVTGDEARIAP